MRILLLPGIWPPDVGGPATHGPDFARFLVGRGHQVRVVTMADDDVTDRPCAVETVSRRNPFPIRYSVLAARAAQFARQSDVVYVSATYAAAAAATVAARRPLVAKLVSDPAYERAYRYGLFRGTLEEFQSAGGAAVVGLRRARTLALSRARTIVVPSEYLARIARGFGVDPARVLVVPNPAPDVPPSRQEPRPGTFVYAGRLTRQKALGIAIDAVALVPGARLVVVGDGPERAMLENRALRAGLEGRIATGRICPMPPWSRSPSGPPSSPPASAAFPRSSTTVRTGCSSPRGRWTRSPKRCSASPTILRSARGLRLRLLRPSPPSPATVSTACSSGCSARREARDRD